MISAHTRENFVDKTEAFGFWLKYRKRLDWLGVVEVHVVVGQV